MRLSGRLNAVLVGVAIVGLAVVVYRSVPQGARDPSGVAGARGGPSSSSPLSTDIKRALGAATRPPGLQPIDARRFSAKLRDWKIWYIVAR